MVVSCELAAMVFPTVHYKKYQRCLSFFLYSPRHSLLATCRAWAPASMRLCSCPVCSEQRSWSMETIWEERKLHRCHLIQRMRGPWTPSQSQIPADTKGVITRARTRRPFRKPYSEFPGHWMDGKGRDMFVSVFEMSCKLNRVADKSEEQ